MLLTNSHTVVLCSALLQRAVCGPTTTTCAWRKELHHHALSTAKNGIVSETQEIAHGYKSCLFFYRWCVCCLALSFHGLLLPLKCHCFPYMSPQFESSHSCLPTGQNPSCSSIHQQPYCNERDDCIWSAKESICGSKAQVSSHFFTRFSMFWNFDLCV